LLTKQMFPTPPPAIANTIVTLDQTIYEWCDYGIIVNNHHA